MGGSPGNRLLYQLRFIYPLEEHHPLQVLRLQKIA